MTRKLPGAFVALLVIAIAVMTLQKLPSAAGGQGKKDPAQREADKERRFSHDANVDPETSGSSAALTAQSEALTGFDNVTNGFDPQGAPYETLDEHSVVPLRSFNDNRFIFEEVETAENGLGPTYNAQSCRECHQNIVTGGASQVTVQRAGHVVQKTFFDSPGGSLIHSRATHPDIMELDSPDDPIRSFRISPSTLGDGYVEAIANATLLSIRDSQPTSIRGTALVVGVLEANGHARIGRFGWKAQHASLDSFAVDAYLNEMGITTPLLPDENTSGGRDTSAFDPVPDPENEEDAPAFANFMRATKAPPRGAITATVLAGEQVFIRAGCAACHIPSITTAPAGTVINGGKLTVRPAVGNKVIHPYSDFLMHDVGTGDGIPIQPTAEYASTATQFRTAPLWGLRTRNRLMHDGLTFTRQDAVQRHGGQASASRKAYQQLSSTDRAALLAFLNSL
jgi:CxxC motif-containing protein (DUF1111 family)